MTLTDWAYWPMAQATVSCYGTKIPNFISRTSGTFPGAVVVRNFVWLFFTLAHAAAAYAQGPPPVLAPGNAAVAGFSGARAIGGPAPAGAQAFDKTFIDLNGPALRVIDLGRMGGPAQGQLVAAPKPFTVTADRIGQVFSIALDDASPPNIYAGRHVRVRIADRRSRS